MLVAATTFMSTLGAEHHYARRMLMWQRGRCLVLAAVLTAIDALMMYVDRQCGCYVHAPCAVFSLLYYPGLGGCRLVEGGSARRA